MPSGGKSQTISQQELAPEQRQLLEFVIPKAEAHVQSPPTLYPGSSIAPMDPLQQAGQTSAIHTAQKLQPFTDRVLGATGDLAGGAAKVALPGAASMVRGFGAAQPARDFMLSGVLMHPGSNPVLEAQTEAAIRPIAHQLNTQVLPGIRQEFTSNGMVGSSRQGIAEGLAMQEFLKQSGDISTNLQANNFNQGLGAMLAASEDATRGASSAVGQTYGAGTQAMLGAPGMMGAAFTPATTMSAVGDVRRSFEQAKLDEEVERHAAAQMLPFLAAQDVAQLAFGFGGGKTTTTGKQPGVSPLQAGMGIGSLILSALPMMISDRRLKKNIKLVGKTHQGYNLYRFNYIWPSETQLGVMADEVPQRLVHTHPSGYKVVDYSQISW